MASNSSVALAVSTGAAAICAGVMMCKLSWKYEKLESTNGKDLCEVAQSIDVDAVGGLLSSPDAKVRKSAELFLMNRASSRKNLEYFLQVCLSSDIDEVLKAVTVVHMLAQHSDDLKGKLIGNKAVSILCDVMERISNNYDYKYVVKKLKDDTRWEKIFYCTVGSLFHLVLRDTITTLQFCNEDRCIKKIFLPIIGDQGFHLSTDVKRWTLYLVHQLILSSETHPIKQSLLQLGIVVKVTECLIKTLGDILQTHLCLQILIQYLTGVSQTDNLRVCKTMIFHGITPHLVGLLRCEEDDNVIQVSAIILHHFCCYELEVKYIVSIPSIVKILCTVLNNTNANIQKTIIRICNYLSVSSSQFQKNLIEHEPIIRRLSICLSSGNPDVVYGSLMLLHDLVMPGKEYAYQIINKNPDILKALVKLALSYTGETMQLIPETLGFICSCESLHTLILQYGVLDAILHFAKSVDVEVQFWASALLLNLSMISDEVKESLIRCGGVHILLEMAVSGDEVDLPDIATNATKTLVMMGFLDAKIDVCLASGLEGSIIIDGTEYCPGKQGINAVVFDFIKYQFHKGVVIDPSDLLAFFENPDFTISDSVFFVTQGDCTIAEADSNVMKKYLKQGDGNLNCPSWCWIYMPNDMQIKYSGDNIQLDTQIQMKDLLGTVLEENFTDPLIDVILSMPPSSNINKLDELGLIEILTRHYHQRKAIVSTSGFLEYLFELIWSVSALKHNEYHMEANKSKVSHCTSALKIIQSCSNDKDSLKEMVHRGLLHPLVSLLQDLIMYCYNECINTPTKKRGNQSRMSARDSHQRESRHERDVKDELAPKLLGNAIYEEPAEDLADECDGSYIGTCVTNLSYSDDNIFQSELDSEVDSTTNQDFQLSHTSRTISQSNISTPNPRSSTRNRTDSFILRANAQNRRSEHNQRSMSLADESVYGTRTLGGSISAVRHSAPQTPDHHQLRRISRSMSLSLQQAKYTEEYVSQIEFSDDTLNKIGKYIVMTLHSLILNGDEEMKQKLLDAHVLPFLYGYIKCISKGLHHERVWLAISSCLHHLSSEGKGSHCRGDVFMHHVDTPRSIVFRSDGLELSNENWYFESVIASQQISKNLYSNEKNHPSGWYYEVTVHSDGVMQIGWANEVCKFYPEKGCGVGDTLNSCGYDGARCKIWNGPCRDMVQENNYGAEWQKDDVISVVLSWDGELRYWINGLDMGASSCKIDTDISWYPAISLAIGQHCVVAFNESSFKYKPPFNYASIDEVYKYVNPKVTAEILPSQTFSDLFSKESDIISTYLSEDLYLLYYYEIDFHQIPKDTEISLGFTLFKKRCKENNPPVEKQTPCESDAVELVKCFPTTFLNDNGDTKRLKIVGCGILSNHCFIITVDGLTVFEKLVKDMVSVDVDITNLFFDVIPFISNPYFLVNFGQEDFIYGHANSSKLKLLDNLCKLKDS